MGCHHKLIIIALAFLFLAAPAFAINFGSTAKSELAEIKLGEEATFELLFWTSDRETQKVVLQASAPKDWDIIFSRNGFFINADKGEEAIFTGSQYVRATPVTVTVRALRGGSMTVSAKNIPEGDGMAFSQERLFNLTVRIEGEIQRNSTETAQITAEKENDNSYIYSISESWIAASLAAILCRGVHQEMYTSLSEILIYFIVIGVIIIISAAIYKYA